MDIYSNVNDFDIWPVEKRRFFQYMDGLRALDRWQFDNKNAYRQVSTETKYIVCMGFIAVLTDDIIEYLKEWETKRLGHSTEPSAM